MSTITARAKALKPIPPLDEADVFLREHGLNMSRALVLEAIVLARVLQNQIVPIGFVNIQNITDAHQLGRAAIADGLSSQATEPLRVSALTGFDPSRKEIL